MDILSHIQPQRGRTVVALGYFDGVHLGHRAVLDTACGLAQERGALPAALTFDMHRRRAAAKGQGDLDTYAHRAARMAACGLSLLVQLDFGEISALTPVQFAQTALGAQGLNAAAVCCGADFRFGCERAGDIGTLRALGREIGFETVVVPAVEADGEPVSTSRIKGYVRRGEIERARALLGHPYSFALPVCADKKLARRLGFPTINQQFPQTLLPPRFGVYRAAVRLDGAVYDGISNIGVRPSVHSDGCVMLETHIIGFAGDLYGRTVEVELLSFLRDEMKFASVDALRAQVERDIDTVRQMAAADGAAPAQG